MFRLSTLAIATGLAVAGASLAQAESPVAGKWNYKVGNSDAACTLTLTANSSETAGDIAASDGCVGGLSAVAHWRVTGSNLNLISPSGDLVAVLHQKGDTYVGTQVGGGRKLALSR